MITNTTTIIAAFRWQRLFSYSFWHLTQASLHHYNGIFRIYYFIRTFEFLENAFIHFLQQPFLINSSLSFKSSFVHPLHPQVLHPDEPI